MTSTPVWTPPAKVLEAEQWLERTEEIYRALWLALYLRARADETMPSEVAIIACLDLANDLAEHSGLLWSAEYDFVAKLRRHADQLEQRRASQPTPPAVIDALAAVLRAGRPPATQWRLEGEFVAHDSKPRFGRMNHGLAADLNIASVRRAASAVVECPLRGQPGRDMLRLSSSQLDPFQTTGITVDRIGCCLGGWRRSPRSNTSQQPIQFREEAQQLTMISGPSCIPATHLRKNESLQSSFLRDHILA